MLKRRKDTSEAIKKREPPIIPRLVKMRIIIACEHSDKSMKEIYSEANIPKSSFYRYTSLRNDKIISRSLLAKLASILELPPAWFYHGSYSLEPVNRLLEDDLILLFWLHLSPKGRQLVFINIRAILAVRDDIKIDELLKNIDSAQDELESPRVKQIDTPRYYKFRVAAAMSLVEDQRVLAILLGATQRELSNWQSKKPDSLDKLMPIDYVSRLAQYTGIPRQWFFSGDLPMGFGSDMTLSTLQLLELYDRIPPHLRPYLNLIGDYFVDTGY